MKPKVKFFAEIGEDMINADGAIEMMRTADTPQARAIYKVFRRHLAKRREDASLTPEKQREHALFDALEEAGARLIDHGKLSGTMDD
jgi:hypothetical protein